MSRVCVASPVQHSRENVAQPPTQPEAVQHNEQTFSLRGILAGGVIGTPICFASLYYGLQAGQTNSMPLPSVLLAYAVFKPFAKCLRRPFNANENVLVMTVAASMGGIPYTAGLSGVIPALEFLAPANDNGPMTFTLLRLILWCLGVCLFGIVYAVPLRKYFVLKSYLRFPTGTAMAAVIGILHKKSRIMETVWKQQSSQQDSTGRQDTTQSRTISTSCSRSPNTVDVDSGYATLDNRNIRSDDVENLDINDRSHTPRLQPGLISFVISGLIALLTYYFPRLQTLPVFGTQLAQKWAWSIDASPTYVGFGMIMHPFTTAHMFLGAIIGWALLSPLAKAKGWAPGRVEDWDKGSQGWNIWVALGVILGDSMVGIAWIIYSLLKDASQGGRTLDRLLLRITRAQSKAKATLSSLLGSHYSSVDERAPLLTSLLPPLFPPNCNLVREPDADGRNDRASDRINEPLSNSNAILWFAGVTTLCIFIMWYLFRDLLRIWEIVLSVILMFPLGIASIRSMGETDNALASSLGKIPQFLFALLVPKTNPNAILISLLVGGIAEGGTYQSSDVMEHLKTGHLVGASPKSLFYGQIAGSILGAIVCSCIYKLFSYAYAIPSDKFTVPHAQLWLASAHLAYGRGLPPGAFGFALAGFIISAILAFFRIMTDGRKCSERIPSGIAIGIGIYILPMYTMPQALGGLAHYLCKNVLHTGELPVITVAVGLILGQSLINIGTLLLGFVKFPHS